MAGGPWLGSLVQQCKYLRAAVSSPPTVTIASWFLSVRALSRMEAACWLTGGTGKPSCVSPDLSAGASSSGAGSGVRSARALHGSAAWPWGEPVNLCPSTAHRGAELHPSHLLGTRERARCGWRRSLSAHDGPSPSSSPPDKRTAHVQTWKGTGRAVKGRVLRPDKSPLAAEARREISKVILCSPCR